MRADAVRVAWYRFRRTLHRRWGGYLALTLLLGLVGGLAMGSVAAARRTQAAFPVYLASTNPSDLTVLTGLSGVAGSRGYDPAMIAKIAALPQVRHVATYLGLNAAVGGVPASGSQGLSGSLDGEFFTTDKVTVLAGRMADLARADEVVIDVKGTPPGVRIGQVVPIGFFTKAQLAAPPGKQPPRPYRTVSVKIVGAVAYSSEEAQDDVDVQRDGGALFTPALTRLLARCCAAFAETAVQLRPGVTVASAEAAIQDLLPKGFPIEFYVAGQTEARAARAAEPNAILVSLRPGADLAAQQAILRRIVPSANGGVVSGVQRPAEITDYQSMGTAPLILAAALAGGAVASLWLTLAASVRRRRADLALLKALGFTRRQLAATVAWQSATAVAAGAVAGVPLGIALGRYLWDRFATQISVVPDPSVPVRAVILVVLGALVAANLVALLPGRATARIPAAALLRAE